MAHLSVRYFNLQQKLPILKSSFNSFAGLDYHIGKISFEISQRPNVFGPQPKGIATDLVFSYSLTTFMIEVQLHYIIKKLNQDNQEGVYNEVENALSTIMGFIDSGGDDAKETDLIERNNMLNKMDIAEKIMHYLNYNASTSHEVRRKFLAQGKNNL